MSMDLIKKLVELKTWKRELDKELEEVKKQIEELEDQVIEYMAKEGLSRVTVNDKTVYVYEDVRASVPKEKIAEFKKIAGDLVKETVNSNSVTAWLKERLREINEKDYNDAWNKLSKEIKDLISAKIAPKVGMRKAK